MLTIVLCSIVVMCIVLVSIVVSCCVLLWFRVLDLVTQ